MAEYITKENLAQEFSKFRLEFGAEIKADMDAVFKRNNQYLIEQLTNMFDHLSGRLHKVELITDDIHSQTKILQKILLRIETHENRIDDHDDRIKRLENVSTKAKAG